MAHAVVLAGLVAGCMTGWSAAADGTESATDVRRLVGEFRRAADPAARETVAAELLAAGADGAEALLAATRSEFVRLEKAHAGRFQRTAADVIAVDARLAADRELLLLLADLATRAVDRLPEATRRTVTAIPLPTAAAVAVTEETACLLALPPASR